MWELDYKESWTLKNWWFWSVVLEENLQSTLGCKKIKPVNPKLNQSWIFIGKMDAEAETLILWPPDGKKWLIGKDPDAGKNWKQEEKGITEDEMIGWHHQLDEHEFEQAPGDGYGQGSLMCCSPWGRKESEMTEQLNWTEPWSILLGVQNVNWMLTEAEPRILSHTCCLWGDAWLSASQFLLSNFISILNFWNYKLDNSE